MKLIAVIGPTASGKSDLAVELALCFGGEVVSADSRQVYRGLDIGSGKITKEEMKGVPHHLLDVADPRVQFSVAEFQEKARVAIENICSRGKVPIICGGTAQYVKSIIYPSTIPDVPPNPELRTELEMISVGELFLRLQKLDPRRAAEIKKDNPRRLVRAIEIATALGKVPESATLDTRHSTLILGLLPPRDELRERIHKRLITRLDNGMIEEVERLHTGGLTWERLDSFGLEYRFVSHYLQGFLTFDEMVTKLNTAIWKYSRRQLTWWKKDERVHWLWDNAIDGAANFTQKFLTNNLSSQA